MSPTPIDPLLTPRVQFDDAGYGEDESDASEAIGPQGEGATVVRLVETFESAYQRLYPQLKRLARLLVDNTEHAEEAVQDAFAKAYPQWGRVQDPNAYMRRSVVNTCRLVQRRRSIVRRFVPQRHEDAVLGADHVEDVVRRLPMALRQLVVLRYYLQLSDAEIALTLDMAPGTVKSSLHRARAHLREELS